jgi:hypothetical protein
VGGGMEKNQLYPGHVVEQMKDCINCPDIYKKTEIETLEIEMIFSDVSHIIDDTLIINTF